MLHLNKTLLLSVSKFTNKEKKHLHKVIVLRRSILNMNLATKVLEMSMCTKYLINLTVPRVSRHCNDVRFLSRYKVFHFFYITQLKMKKMNKINYCDNRHSPRFIIHSSNKFLNLVNN